MRLVLICALALMGQTLAYKSYEGYQVLETGELDLGMVKRMAPLLNVPDLDFWKLPHVGGTAQIMVSPELAEPVKISLENMGLKPTVIVPDVQVVIAKERAEIEAVRQSEKNGKAAEFNRFYDFNEIQAYLDEVVAAYPQIASIINIGSSYEGRPMRVLKLSNGAGKTGVFYDVAIHAREWLGPPTVMYLINELTENLAENQAILDANDFYLLPVANPDGYSYTWTDDRLWRKTRSPNGGICVGTDPNRNFDQNWAGGGIPSACSETYPGSGPFSEVEVKAISDFIAATQSINFAVSVHSCGNYLLYPWGDTTDLPPNAPELERIGTAALDALRAVSGTRYQLGSIANVLYEAYGGSIDWYYAKQNVELNFAFELPCGGSAGFNPPPSAILPVAIETWEAYKVFAANIPVSRRS